MKFEKIAPKWARAIEIFKEQGYVEYVKYLNKNKLNIQSDERCIVGEAYHWKGYYEYHKKCEICYGFSYKFLNGFEYGGDDENIFSMVKRPIPELASIQVEFEKHWCEKHSK